MQAREKAVEFFCVPFCSFLLLYTLSSDEILKVYVSVCTRLEACIKGIKEIQTQNKVCPCVNFLINFSFYDKKAFTMTLNFIADGFKLQIISIIYHLRVTLVECISSETHYRYCSNHHRFIFGSIIA